MRSSGESADASLVVGPMHAIDPSVWDAFVQAHPDGHLLQLAGWGRLKSAFGWSAAQVAVRTSTGQIAAGATVLFRRLPLRLGQMAYIPAGPLFAAEGIGNDAALDAALWQAVGKLCRARRAAFLKVEPCNWYRPRPDLPARLESAGFVRSPQTVQPPRTVIVDLTGDEETILRRMNQSTRYKARLGPKKDVAVREASAADVDSFTHLMAVTGARDGFGIHDAAYYRMAYDEFVPAGLGALILGSYAGQDLAGVMVFRCGDNAYYLYGASSDAERNRMATYIVQWEAMRWAKAHGALRYDLWGVPDAEPEQLEAHFESRRDGLWGVYGFKRGFGGQVVRSVGAWDRPYNRLLYAAYRWYIRRQRREDAP